MIDTSLYRSIASLDIDTWGKHITFYRRIDEPVCLSLTAESVNYSTVFFSHNKSTSNVSWLFGQEKEKITHQLSENNPL